MTLFIWCHSLAPAEQSSVESGRIVALLGMAWMATLAREKAITWPRKAGTAAVACMVTALVDETIQLFVPGRSGQISDVWIDTLGAIIGIAIGFPFIFPLMAQYEGKSADTA